MSEDELNELMTSNKANMVQARDAIYGINNDKIYETIDLLKKEEGLNEETAAATEALTQKILEEVDARTALNYANDPEQVEKLTKALAKAKVDGISVGEILTSDDYDLKEKLDAYEEAIDTLQGDQEAVSALKEAFNEFELFQNMTDSALKFIDAASLSYDQINELHDITRQLNKELADTGFQITEDADVVFEDLLNNLAANGEDLGASINSVFGDYLNEMEYMGED
jgi:hypothetical protein